MYSTSIPVTAASFFDRESELDRLRDLPLRFGLAAWRRMEAEAERFGWRWIVAAVTPPPESRLMLLDPAAAKVRRGVTLEAEAAIENLLLWIDRGGSRS